MALTPRDPFEERTPLREAMNRLLEESFIGSRRFEPFARVLPVDLRETDTGYELKASLPGIKPEEIQVTAAGNTITIHTSTKRETKAEEAGTYVRQERYEGELTRSISLPGAIDRDRITATYAQGVLTLSIPKTEEAKAKSVNVQVKAAEPTQ